MIITNARRDDAGDWKFDMQMSEEEVSFLVEISVTSLIKVGMLDINEQAEPQEVSVLQNAPSSEELQ